MKVSFDIVKRLINVIEIPAMIGGENVLVLDIQVDLYSDGKEAWVADNTLRKLKFPIRTVGGDDLPGNRVLGDTYFIRPDWKIAPYEISHRLQVLGNFYSEDGTSPFNKTIGNYNIFLEQTLSSIVETELIEVGSGVTAQDKTDIIDGVWSKTLP